MLSLLDKYLYNNPKQHTHCMSSDNEYVALAFIPLINIPPIVAEPWVIANSGIALYFWRVIFLAQFCH